MTTGVEHIPSLEDYEDSIASSTTFFTEVPGSKALASAPALLPIESVYSRKVVSAEQTLGKQCNALDDMLAETDALHSEIQAILHTVRQDEARRYNVHCSADMSISQLLQLRRPQQQEPGGQKWR